LQALRKFLVKEVMSRLRAGLLVYMGDKFKGKKLEMSQVFLPEGTVVPVTLMATESWPRTLAVGQRLKVTGVSKGKGFAGVVKRHHFKGGPRTHGQSDRERHPGAIGQTTTPGHVYKGKRMAGRMGGEQVTIKSTKVVEIDAGRKILKLSGPIPGARNSQLWMEVYEA